MGNWNLSISESWWYVLICLLVAVSYSAFLYYRNADRGLFEGRLWLKLVLSVARALIVFVLCFFLLNPVLNVLNYRSHKPTLLFVVDDSQSISKAGITQQEMKTFVSDWVQELEEKFDLRLYSLGDRLTQAKADSLNLLQGNSDLSSLFRQQSVLWRSAPLAATVLVSDGIYNKGVRPSLLAEQSKVPVYTLGLGDTTSKVDLKIDDVYYNRTVFKGSSFPFLIDLRSQAITAAKSQLSVRQNGELVHQQGVDFSETNDFIELELSLSAEALGPNLIEVQLQSIDAEQNKHNNNYRCHVDVIDSHKEVVLWTHSSHPDIGAMKTLIQTKENTQLQVVKHAFQVEEQDLVILYDWFRDQRDLSLFEELKTKGVPCLIVMGPAFSAELFNRGTQQLRFEAYGQGSNQSGASSNIDFDYFHVAQETSDELEVWPPLRVPFGKFAGYSVHDVLFFQRIGAVKTEQPLILLRNEQHYRYGVIAGTGLWQWRLTDYVRNERWNHSSDLLEQMIQFLSVKQERKSLSVYPQKKRIAQGGTQVVTAELVDRNLDLVQGAEITLKITRLGGESLERLMVQRGDLYQLQLRQLEPGIYDLQAKARLGGEDLTDRSYFTVDSNQMELMDLQANKAELRSIAQASGGQYFDWDNRGALKEQLFNNEDFSSVIKEERNWTDLLDSLWIFWLLVGLLSFEWFVRKFIGGY